METCLLVVGKVSAVWGRVGGALGAAPGPVAETACMLDMLLLPAGGRAPRAQASARVTFRLVCCYEKARETLLLGTNLSTHTAPHP